MSWHVDLPPLFFTVVVVFVKFRIKQLVGILLLRLLLIGNPS